MQLKDRIDEICYLVNGFPEIYLSAYDKQTAFSVKKAKIIGMTYDGLIISNIGKKGFPKFENIIDWELSTKNNNSLERDKTKLRKQIGYTVKKYHIDYDRLERYLENKFQLVFDIVDGNKYLDKIIINDDVYIELHASEIWVIENNVCSKTHYTSLKDISKAIKNVGM